MKVICIDTPKSSQPGITSFIRVGHEYTVIDSGPAGQHFQMGPWYELAERKGYAYGQHLFATLSDIDESTFEREYNKEKV